MKKFLMILFFIWFQGCVSLPKDVQGAHIVEKGETLSHIAFQFGVSVHELADFNRIKNPDEITVGQRILIPGGVHNRKYRNGVISYEESIPLRGRISSSYGMRAGRMHRGLDIAAPMGSPVRSVRKGFVVAAKWIRGFGKTVKVKTGNNVYLYAHLDEINVKKGNIVQRGQKLGRVGQTGNATGPHLHFEVIQNGRHINPEVYLSSLQGLVSRR